MLKTPPQPGQSFGCTDTVPPENCSSYELSRVLDLMQLAEELGIKDVIWGSLAYNVKFDFNFAKWAYQERVWGRCCPTDLEEVKTKA
jgi:hypothetical protein